MKAAYKWKIQNGVYGYITDEENKIKIKQINEQNT